MSQPTEVGWIGETKKQQLLSAPGFKSTSQSREWSPAMEGARMGTAELCPLHSGHCEGSGADPGHTCLGA